MQNASPADALAIAEKFNISSPATGAKPFGAGHINHTFLINTADGTDYILQQVNKGVFHNPEEVMANVTLVTDHLRAKIQARGGDETRETLTLIPTKEKNFFVLDPEDDLWRMYLRIENTISYQLPENTGILREAGRAFGAFQMALGDCNAVQIHETIPHFHDTPSRVAAFKAAVQANRAGRTSSVADEIQFVLDREEQAHCLTDALAAGKLPLRVTHNDTKLDNVLIDGNTQKGLCVVDLDTVMPGLAAYDFGDALRFGANTALEDERDLAKVHFSMPMYKAWTEGFMNELNGIYSKEEILSLPMGAWMMTYECGLRFLADYLDGDHYFHIAYEDHNLVRARNQFALLRDIEAHLPEMNDYIANWIKED